MKSLIINTEILKTRDNAILLKSRNSSFNRYYKLTKKNLQNMNSRKLKNILFGESVKYCLRLKVNGVGYRIEQYSNEILVLKLGFSHLVNLNVPKSINLKVTKKTYIIIQSSNFFILQNFAMRLKSICLKDIYKGKGIYLVNDSIRLKEGKKK